ncbi:ABC transporter permease [Streptomyces collinus]|uniref:ABC transporter permease n=1 Tax=Streptomyces collinus TaxID=42684 RepID=UPI0036E0288A
MNSPLLFLSGGFFPLENLPGWARTLAAADPLAYGVDLLRRCIALRVPGHVATAGVEWAGRQRPLLLEGALLRAGGAAALIWAAHPFSCPGQGRSAASTRSRRPLGAPKAARPPLGAPPRQACRSALWVQASYASAPGSEGSARCGCGARRWALTGRRLLLPAGRAYGTAGVRRRRGTAPPGYGPAWHACWKNTRTAPPPSRAPAARSGRRSRRAAHAV